MAAFRECETFTGELRQAALAVPGVRQVAKLDNAVAVIADHYWAAGRVQLPRPSDAAHEVEVVKSSEKPGGIGEPGTSTVIPAIFNAVHAATGVRLRKMSIRPDLLKV